VATGGALSGSQRTAYTVQARPPGAHVRDLSWAKQANVREREIESERAPQERDHRASTPGGQSAHAELLADLSITYRFLEDGMP
jgi:hypothetical protein